MRKLIASVPIAIGLLTGGTTVAHAMPVMDQIFLNMIHEAGVPLSDAEALDARPEVCQLIETAGGRIVDAVAEVKKKYPTFTEQQAVTLVGGSQVSLCPPPKK